MAHQALSLKLEIKLEKELSTNIDTNKYASKILEGDVRTLSKSITLMESQKIEHQNLAYELLEKVLPYTGKSQRIGISGIPGVGKSTFIEAFGMEILKESTSKLAVLAVDPSSPLHGGSLMGDKTRMETLSQHKRTFIRPSPSIGSLGGVSLKTRECILLCEAAGFNTILVETVGVGQSEVDVANMVDLFMLLMLPNAGDELQGLKKGILELADFFIINKADGNTLLEAQRSQQQLRSAFQIFNNSQNAIPIELCSALEKKNIPQIWKLTQDFFSSPQTEEKLKTKRVQQNLKWFDQLILTFLKNKISEEASLNSTWKTLKQNVGSSKTPAFLAAKELINHISIKGTRPR